MEILLLVLGLVLFVALVVVHEWGHFIMARRNGVDVEEFGIGFPPKLWTFYKDKKGTEYTINLLPLGGFVRLKGEHDADKDHGAYGSVSLWSKTKIILAGVVMNLFTAWVLFTILALIGMPKLPLPGGEEQFTIQSDTTLVSNRVFVSYVEPEGPADAAGIKQGDELRSVVYKLSNPVSGANRPDDGACSAEIGDCSDIVKRDLKKSSELRDWTEEGLKAGSKDIGIILLRDGDEQQITVSPRSLEEVELSKVTDKPKGYLGILPQDFTIQRSTWSAPIVGAGVIAQYSRLTYSALGNSIASLFQGKGSEASENVSGPVGIFVVLRDGATLGMSYILLVVASLSLTLAIMNTLPIPALDGGKLAVMLLFRAIKKPLTASMEEKIHGTGFVLLMVLFLVITTVDIRRFF